MTLKSEIAKILTKYNRFSYDEIYRQLKIYDSVDLLLNSMHYADKVNISLEEACLRLYNH